MAQAERQAKPSLWLAAHFPMLGFEVQKDYQGAASALVEGHRAVQTNAPAREAGVAAGMTLATARGVVAGLRHFARDARAERDRLARLALVGYRFSPRVSLAPPAGLLLEVAASLGLFGDLETLAEALAMRLRQHGHETRLAAAETPLAALLLARAGLAGLPGDAKAAVRRAPLACAGLPAAQLERLENMGFHRVGPLLALPPAELAQRFDAPLADYLARLAGRRADPREFIEPPERFRSAVHLLESVDDKNALLFPMRRLAAQLADWLVARRFGAEGLLWEFRALRGATANLAVRFADPVRNPAAFLALSKLRLERAALPPEVMSVSLRAELVAPFAPPAADLFAAPGGASRVELVDQLTARLGGAAIRLLTRRDDHRPERAWDATAPTRSGRRGARQDAGAPPAANRPLWLLDAPRPVAIGEFQLLAGPERIQTGWWGGAAYRDYFVAAARNGAQCWLFRDRRGAPGVGTGEWYLHGYFA